MELPTVFDETRRYIVTNWTDRDFSYTWGGKAESIKAGDYKDLPEFMAYHVTKHLVDRELHKDGKDQFLGVEEIRSPYEQKTMTAIDGTTDSPALANLKKQIAAETEEMKNADVNVVETTEFAALKDKKKK